MPTTLADDVYAAARGIRDIHLAAEAQLLQAVARAVKRGVDPSRTWAGRELLARQELIRDLDRILRDLENKVPGAVQEAHRIAYGAGSARADQGLPGAYPKLPLPAATPEAVLVRAALDAAGMRYQIRRWVLDVYDKATQEAAAMVASGVMTRRQASAHLLARLTEQGITGFVDRAGRQWEMGAYAEMAVRASSMNAALQGHSDRLLSYGIDLAYISDHTEECERCRPWEGKIVSLSGETRGRLEDGARVKGTLADAQADGVFHPGCRHTTSAYLPGITQVPRDTADPGGDRLRQQQRAWERDIRRRKRKLAALEGVDGRDSRLAREERARLAERRSEFARWREQHDRKNLAYRENIKTR